MSGLPTPNSVSGGDHSSYTEELMFRADTESEEDSEEFEGSEDEVPDLLPPGTYVPMYTIAMHPPST